MTILCTPHALDLVRGGEGCTICKLEADNERLLLKANSLHDDLHEAEAELTEARNTLNEIKNLIAGPQWTVALIHKIHALLSTKTRCFTCENAASRTPGIRCSECGRVITEMCDHDWEQQDFYLRCRKCEITKDV